MTKIESTAIIEENVKIGKDCYIGHFTIIRPGVVIGDNSEIRAHCFIAPNAKIGNNTNIYQYSNICQDAIIEDCVYIGPKVLFTNTRKIAFNRNYDFICTPPYVEYGVRIGGGVVLCPNVRLRKNCMIGAGAVVTKDTEEGWMYVGNPAKKIRLVNQEELI
jgi:UDP-2-acetamido-3-amino-2,3-dideoxy-glucuronate N-acetyltransferase